MPVGRPAFRALRTLKSLSTPPTFPLSSALGLPALASHWLLFTCNNGWLWPRICQITACPGFLLSLPARPVAPTLGFAVMSA